MSTEVAAACDITDVKRVVEHTGATVGALELRLPDALEIGAWAEIGRKLMRSDQVLKWWIGDWAAFGIRKYGQLKEFAEANGINYAGLRQLAWVSESVELSRRRDNLEWSKHQEVAALPPQDQEKWLSKAATEPMTVAELRRQIRQGQGEQNALAGDGPVVRFASKAVDDLVHWLKVENPDVWPEERREAWRNRLQPIVDFWRQL